MSGKIIYLDQIGRDKVLNQVDQQVRRLGSEKSLRIMLNGAWGSGKTQLMHLVEQRYQKDDDKVVVYYDAWANNYYKDPLIAMLYCIHDTIQKNYSDKVKPNIKEKIKIKEILKLIRDNRKDIIQVVEECAERYKGDSGVTVMFTLAVKIIISIIRQAKKSIIDNENFKEFKSYQQMLDESKLALNALTSAQLQDGNNIKLIILIDEIDRCLPKEQLLILERMHHLFALGNCMVVVALNSKVVRLAIQKEYGIPMAKERKDIIDEVFEQSDKPLEDEYLEKFFQIEIPLPAKSQILFRQKLIDDVVQCKESQSNIKATDKCIGYIDDILQGYYQTLGKFGHQVSNRTICAMIDRVKRIVGRLAFSVTFGALMVIVYIVMMKEFAPLQYDKMFRVRNVEIDIDLIDDALLSQQINYTAIEFYDEEYKIYKDKDLNDINKYYNKIISILNCDEIETYECLYGSKKTEVDQEAPAIVNAILEELR